MFRRGLYIHLIKDLPEYLLVLLLLPPPGVPGGGPVLCVLEVGQVLQGLEIIQVFTLSRSSTVVTRLLFARLTWCS